MDDNIFDGKSDIDLEYRVYAFYKDFESDKISINRLVFLSPPSQFSANSSSLHSVTLNWMGSGTVEEGFKIERKFGTGDWVEVATTTITAWHDSNIELNTMIYYRICAYRGDYRSAYAETSYDATLPGPTDLQITQNNIASITLNWQDHNGGELPIIIERKYETGDWVQIGYIHSIFWPDNDFELNTMVYYRVYVRYSNYTSAYAINSFDASLLPPLNFQITQNSLTEVTLFWQFNMIDGVAFKIERKYATGDWVALATTSGTSWQDNDFELNTLVHYRIRAVYNQYMSDWVENSFYADIPDPASYK